MKNIVAFYQGEGDGAARLLLRRVRPGGDRRVPRLQKALGALKEAHEYDKARVQGREDKLASFQQRIVHVEAFVNARKMVKSSPEQMGNVPRPARASRHRVRHPRRRCAAARAKPVTNAKNRTAARCSAGVCTHGGVVLRSGACKRRKLIEQMRERGIVLSPYVDAEMVRGTYAVGAVPPNAPSNDVAGGGEDEIEEERGV